MGHWVDKVKAARELPLGHYAKGEAEALVTKEYSLSREVEARIKNKDVTLEAARICARITTILGVPKVKKLLLEEDIWPASANYWRREIKFCSSYIYLRTLLHELAHHVQYSEKGFGHGHGEGFARALNLVIDAYNAVEV